MEPLIIASNNAHKVTEIQQILQQAYSPIRSMAEAGLHADIPETGQTFAENACMKAQFVTDQLRAAALADDSGLQVDILGGKPGIYSARFCGRHGDDAANNEKMRKMIQGVPAYSRGARYACAIALTRPDQAPVVSMGYCYGEILDTYVGEGGFGYDPLFFLPQLGLSMAQLTAEQKNAISHRYQALCGLQDTLWAQQEGCMRIGVISDSHGRKAALTQAIAQMGKLDKLFFLGDGEWDIEELIPQLDCPVIRVRGNGDFSSASPEMELLDLEGSRVLLCHGHTQQVKVSLRRIKYTAKTMHADAVLFGHTHRPYRSVEDGILYLNPGALPGYALLYAKNGKIGACLHEI